MAHSLTSCPRCKTRVPVEYQQVFDLNQDPEAKNKLLSRQFNLIQCPTCGYQGSAPTPIVYHDSDKELLLTYFPPELGLPVNEQEKMVGPLITKIVNALPNEKKKAYLFQPKTMLTMDTMAEHILEADGITKEMIQDQQKKMALLQRLITATPESRLSIIKEEEPNIEESLFAIIGQLAQASLRQGDQETMQQLLNVQKDLMEHTEIGRNIKQSTEETQAAMKDIKALSEKGLTREGLLDLIIQSPSDIYRDTIVSLTRQAIDYTFFQLLSEKIDQSKGEEKQKLTDLREALVNLTQEIDKMIQESAQAAKGLLQKIINAPDTAKAVEENLNQMDDLFVQIVQAELQTARKNDDLEQVANIEKVIVALQKYTAPPPEIQLIESLISAQPPEKMEEILKENSDLITPEFLQLFSQVISQTETQNQPAEMVDLLKKTYKQVVSFSMKKNLAG